MRCRHMARDRSKLAFGSTARLVRHFCEVGFGSPDAVTIVYVVKIALYVLAGWAFVLSTPGIDGFTAADVDTPEDLRRLAEQMSAGDLGCPRTRELLRSWQRLEESTT